MQNSMQVINPYVYNGSWVFDDERVGLVKEPFVLGADIIIDQFVKDIPNARNCFRLIFSQYEFPRYHGKFNWVKADGSGNWYKSEELDMEGWLCPALLTYFDKPPKSIYARFEPKCDR